MRTTGKQKDILNGADLTRLVRRFEAWRRGKRSGERIPEDLWEAAAAAARIHGMTRTCRALRLCCSDLKRHGSPDPKPGSRTTTPTFIELPMPAFTSEPALSLPASLELIRPCGSKLSLQSPGARVGDFLPVIEAFLGL